MAGLSFEVLGPFQVRIGGEPIQIASYKQRSLLALLLMNANTVVSSDRLIDEIWGEQASKSRQNALWVHLSGIRKALANGDTDESSRLVTRSPGYLLRVEDDEVDALAFEKLVREGVALSATDPDAGSLVLSEALALWKGHAYQDFAYEEWAQDEVRRLEESRVAAVEARIDADIHRGMGRQLVGELESLVRTYPLREHLTGQLMIALYRSSRQSEALRAYSVLSERLGEELGIEPSAELRAIEEAIVMGDSSLDAGGMAGAPGVGLVPGLSVRGYEIRSAIGDGALGVAYRAYQPAVGREVALKAIRPELADDPAFVKHFESEAQLVATLEHPHIVPLYDYWREPGGAYLVMRLMKSGSLADRLEQGPLEAEQVSTIATHVGSALDAAHRNGIVHGDVKPGNILLDEEGNAYLTDFSIAVENGEGPSSVDPEYSAPEVVSGDPATPASDVYSLAVVLRRALGRPSGEVSAVLDLATVEDQGRRLQDPLTLADRLADALGTETDAADLRHVPNPYKGLRAFSQADAADFFGRDRLVERLIARVGHSGGSSRFIAVVGPSGSGKSSAVKAGLIPALRAGALPGASTWFYAEMLPAPHPFDHLAETLEGVAIGRQADLLGMLVEDVSGIARAVEAVLPDDGSQLVLVIDQFEELFTQVDPEVADRFLKAMVAAVTDPRCRLRVIATLRADYYDRPLAKRHLGELLRDATEVVTPMTAEELGQAVSGPVSDTGVSFDSALTGRMIADVIDHPGGLPLLQYTLTELFDHRTASIIGMETYDELGGVAGALVNRSEGIYNSLSPEGQEAAREVFLRLVAVGELTEDTRRRVLESELTDAGSGEAVAEVLDRFGRHRLLTFDRDTVSRGPTVEIAHEALIRDWPRFRRWLQTSRADLRAVRRLEDAAQEWERSDRSDGYLLTSGRLAAAEEYVETGTVAPGREALDFVDASRDHEDAEIRTRRARRRRVLAGFGIAAVVGLVLAAVAFVSQQRAVDSEQVARGRALAASAAAVRDEDPELSLLLALSAADLVEPDVQSMTALHRAIAEQRAFMTWVWPVDELGPALAFGALSPDADRMVVTPSEGDSFVLVDVPSGERLWTRRFPWDGSGTIGVNGVFMSDGERIAISVRVSEDGADANSEILGMHIVDAETGATVERYEGERCGMMIAGRPGDDVVPVIVDDCIPQNDFLEFRRELLDLRTGERVRLHTGPPFSEFREWERASYLSVSRDGSVAIAGNAGDTTTVIACGMRPGVHELCEGNSGFWLGPELAWGFGVGYLNSDGSMAFNHAFASGATREVVQPVWESGIVGAIDTPGVVAAEFSADDRLILTGAWTGLLEGFEVVGGEKALSIPAGVGSISRIHESDAGGIVAVSGGTTVRVFDLGAPVVGEVEPQLTPDVVDRFGRNLRIESGFNEVFDAWSPDRSLRAVRQTTDVPLSDVFVRAQPSEEVLARIGPSRHDTELSGIAFHPTEPLLALGWAREVKLVSTTTWEEVAVVSDLDDPRVRGSVLVYTPTGRLVGASSVAGGNGDLVLYDGDTLDVVGHVASAHDAGIRQMHATPDGEHVASRGLDNRIRVWRIADGVMVHEVEVGGPINVMALSDDGRHVIAGLPDGSLTAWTIEQDELLDIARRRLTRALTASECATYGLDPCPTLEESRSG